jgi:hypothetical protein
MNPSQSLFLIFCFLAGMMNVEMALEGSGPVRWFNFAIAGGMAAVIAHAVLQL